MNHYAKDMYKVTWLKPALDELVHIIEYTKTEWGREQAVKLVNIFEKVNSSLAESPKMGRRVRRENVYVWFVPKLPFVILYEFDDKEEVFVNQVIHTSRRR